MLRSLLAVLLSLTVIPVVEAQVIIVPGRRPSPVYRESAFPRAEGPRLGITMLSPGIVDTLEKRYDKEISPVITQFGWQLETQFLSGTGITGISELVLLVGGTEQGLLLPSASTMAGFRTKGGWEIAGGPNFSGAGMAFALAGGVTITQGKLNFPLNVAIVPSRVGTRVSFLVGFNALR